MSQGNWVRVPEDYETAYPGLKEIIQMVFPGENPLEMKIGVSNAGNLKILHKEELVARYAPEIVTALGWKGKINPAPGENVQVPGLKTKAKTFFRLHDAEIYVIVRNKIQREENIGIKLVRQKKSYAVYVDGFQDQLCSIQFGSVYKPADTGGEPSPDTVAASIAASLRPRMDEIRRVINQRRREAAVREETARIREAVMRLAVSEPINGYHVRCDGTKFTITQEARLYVSSVRPPDTAETIGTVSEKDSGTPGLKEYEAKAKNGVTEAMAEKLRKKLVASAFTSASCVLGKEVSDILEEYNQAADPLMNGLPRTESLKIKDVITPFSGRTIKCSAFSIEWKDGKRTVEYKNADILEDMKKKRAVSCIEFFKDFCKSEGISVTVRGTNQDGLMYGRTCVDVRSRDLCFDMIADAGRYSESITKWKKEVRKQILAGISAEKERREKSEQMLKDRYTDIAGSYLMMDVVRFVKKNESYITENAVVQALRGQKVQLNAALSFTEARGKYAMLPGDDVKKAIESLVKQNVLFRRVIKGTYGDFFILKTCPMTGTLCALQPETNLKTAAKKLKKGERLTDMEAELLFSEIEGKAEKTVKDYITAFELSGNTAMACRNLDRYIELFLDAPKEVEVFLSMAKKEMDDPARVKLIAAIIKGRKEKAKAEKKAV